MTTVPGLPQGSAQWDYIAKDLAAVDRSVTPWLIVGFHRPYYTPSVRPAVVSLGVGRHLGLFGPFVQP